MSEIARRPASATSSGRSRSWDDAGAIVERTIRRVVDEANRVA